MDDSKKLLQLNIKKQRSFQKESLQFIGHGIGCNCLIYLYEAGLLNQLNCNNLLNEQEIQQHPQSIPILSALRTLIYCKAVEKENGAFKLTSLGNELCSQIGLLRVLFDGYGNLMSHHKELAAGEIEDPKKLLRGPSISNAAVQLAASAFDSLILEEFKHLKFSGTICDLGCGLGRMLLKICELTNNPGLGFDNESKVVEQAQKMLQNTPVSVERGNITQLNGVWEDVVILLQCHVFHDFESKTCVKIMNSFLGNFPNLKYFYFLDTVAASSDSIEMLPGFDYVHGLLGISPRTYEETLKMFDSSKYNVVKEVKVARLPNTFLWVLTPKST